MDPSLIVKIPPDLIVKVAQTSEERAATGLFDDEVISTLSTDVVTEPVAQFVETFQAVEVEPIQLCTEYS